MKEDWAVGDVRVSELEQQAGRRGTNDVAGCCRGAAGGRQGGAGTVPVTSQEPATALQAILGNDSALP